MATTAERLAALEAQVAALTPAPEADPLVPGTPEVAVARLVVGDVDPGGLMLPGARVYTATAGTLEDLCRTAGVPDNVVEAASKSVLSEALWSGKDDDTTFKAL